MSASRSRLLAWLAVGTLVLVGGSLFVWRAVDMRNAWRAACRAAPDLADKPGELRTRIVAASQRANPTVRDVAALGELAQLYHANGYLPEAEAAYRGLLRFDPRNPRWPHLLAALLAGYGQLDEALPWLQKTVALDPKYAPARLRLGDALLKAGRLDEAETAYQDLLRVAPGDPYALLGLARIDLSRGRLTAAREKLGRASAADPTFFGAQSVLASVFEQLGDDDAAATARARANQAGRFREAPDPWLDGLYDYCFDVYRLQVGAATAISTGRTEAALPLLRRALTLAPDDGRTLRQLGTAYLKLHDTDRARGPLLRAVAVDPDDSMAAVDLAGYYFAVGDVPGAQRTLEAALPRSKDPAPLHAELGGLLLKKGELTAAVDHLEQAVRLSPEKPDVAQNLVTALFQAGRSADAAAALQAALQRSPTFPPLLVQGARYQIRRGDATRAAELMKRAEQAGAPADEILRVMAEYRRAFGANPR